MGSSAEEEMKYLVEVGRPTILEIADENSCIFSTRLAVDYLQSKGILAEPMAVSLVAYSPEFVRRADELGSMPDQQLTQQWFEESPAVWSVGVGVPEKASSTSAGWEGHLVAIVEGRYLLDLSADQVSRPEKQMLVKPFFCELALQQESFLSGGTLSVFSKQHALLLYHARLNDRSYAQAADWRNQQQHDLLLQRLQAGS